MSMLKQPETFSHANEIAIENGKKNLLIANAQLCIAIWFDSIFYFERHIGIRGKNDTTFIRHWLMKLNFTLTMAIATRTGKKKDAF